MHEVEGVDDNKSGQDGGNSLERTRPELGKRVVDIVVDYIVSSLRATTESNDESNWEVSLEGSLT
jgi:hypothetical protein